VQAASQEPSVSKKSSRSTGLGRGNGRSLGLFSATALVVASMIGTGVFTTSGFLLADLKTQVNVLWVWVIGGILACLGALSYGALARRLPESGGEYLFLSRTLHPAVGYVAGWISFLVGFSAPLAFAAFAFGEYSRGWWPAGSPRVSGTVLLLLLSVVHGVHVQRGAWLQNLAVLLKLVLVTLGVALAAPRLSLSPPSVTPPVPLSTWAVSLMWVSFSYSGWNAASYIAGEVREPERNLPRAMVIGTLLVAVLYLLVNAVFVYSAPAEALAGKPDIGRIAAQALGGVAWARAITSLIALVLISSVSAQIMAGPRVYAKMAADGYLPRWLAMGSGPPRGAIAVQAAVALAMLWSASFEWFLTYIGFTLGLSTAVTVLGLVKLRLREGPRLAVVGWPWVPLLFLSGVATTTLLSIIGKPGATATGLGTIALSWVGWQLHRKWSDSGFIQRGGLWVLGQSVLMVGVLVLAVLDRGEGVLVLMLLGGFLILTGAFFGLAGVAVLRGNRTAFPKPREHSRLIREGIYGYVRHPLYTSVILICTGWAIIWASQVALFLALSLIPFFHAKARVEERWLRERYPAYASYERRVRRFVPWLY
jgi:APA family basic amino acid/polyamine antiporter